MPTNGNDTAAIRFLLDGDVHVVHDVSPTTTVLQYLRDHIRRCGTKEGCAEGDCGACTVVLAELVDDELRYRATNSCIQFLPTIDGKALLTVESLKALNGGRLHPVQQAMVECHGSQCGFCTPGFVMSLFALYQTIDNPDDDEISYAIAGNLCRCTGYRPILAAARRMYAVGRKNSAAWEQRLKKQLTAIRVTTEKRLAIPNGCYTAPSNIDELTARLAAAPESTILAGGTDVGLWVTKQHRDLPEIIYLGNVKELGRISQTDEYLEIGASVSLTDAFAALLEEYSDLEEIIRRFASPPICNSGTLCGNVANGSPIGDSMPALICLGASVVLRKGADISKRFEQDICAVCMAISIDVVDGHVSTARVAYGGMAPVPKRADRCERALTGAAWNPSTVGKAIQALSRDFRPITDVRATDDYRLRVAGNLLRRFFVETDQPDQPATVWNYAAG